MLAAQVIGASADPASHTLFINRGERDHVRRNMAVITPDGIVGKIVEVFPAASQVLLINDKDSGVGALFADTRTHGVVKGSGDPSAHGLRRERRKSAGRRNDPHLRRGPHFPQGFADRNGGNRQARQPVSGDFDVQPAARLDRLEDVLVLITQQELTPKKTDVLSRHQRS